MSFSLMFLLRDLRLGEDHGQRICAPETRGQSQTHCPPFESYLLGWHLKETRRYLLLPGQRSGPKTRLLTRRWQARWFWHSSSTFWKEGRKAEACKHSVFWAPNPGCSGLWGHEASLSGLSCVWDVGGRRLPVIFRRKNPDPESQVHRKAGLNQPLR